VRKQQRPVWLLQSTEVELRVGEKKTALAVSMAMTRDSWTTRWHGYAWARYGVSIVALAALYYGSAKLGFWLRFAGPVAAIVWLPTGVGISFLYLGGLRFWPGVLLGDLLVNDYGRIPIGPNLGQTAGNLLEIILAVWLIRRLVTRGSPLASSRGLARMLFAMAVGTLASAAIGSLSLRLGGVVTTSALPDVARTWWLGDLCGAIVVTPFAIAWWRPRTLSWLRKNAVEVLLLLGPFTVLSFLALHSNSPLTYLVFPGLLLAALRFSQRGATLAIVVATACAIWTTTHFQGPFVYSSITRSILDTQLFIAVAAVSTLWLVALVSEREDFARRLGESRIQVLQAADSERRRIERNLHDGAQQRLTALAVRLSLAAEHVPKAPEQVAAFFVQAEADLELAIDELRELGHGVHPSVLTDLGLAPAIRSVVVRSDVPITLEELPSARLDDVAEATAYYVVAEALTNAHKHANADAIHVRAVLVDQTLRVEVRDDGVGGAVIGAGSGLAGLRDRVEEAGGSFSVVSRAGLGTRVFATIPADLG
jgi:signal transduction histidine kinase